MANTLEEVRDYYGKVLQSNADLQTNACCTSESLPPHLRSIVSEIHDDVVSRFYGCGSPIPLALEGQTALDLGCGTGRDCFILSKLVGSKGRVVGIDMTDEQLNVARKYQDYHATRFGHSQSNVEFLNGYIEDLETVGIASNSVDLVVSNCVINLSPNKERVFSEIFRVLKPGGELYFSDVFSTRRIPKHLAEDPVLLGECLGGAMYTEDFRRLLAKLGCADYRVTARSLITLNNKDLEKKVGEIQFHSITVRAFKLDLEDRCEDYGQVAIYRGGIPEAESAFVLDDHHTFENGRPALVCSNTAAMLQNTRYAQYFDIVGDTSTHYGLFDCAPVAASTNAGAIEVGACC